MVSTLDYLSPEARELHDFDFPMDIFAVGKIIWEICHGKKLGTTSASPTTESSEAYIPHVLEVLALACIDSVKSRRITSRQLIKAATALQIDFAKVECTL